MSVRRRHVIYVPGYDPRGVAHYYRMVRTELGRFRGLHGLDGTVSRPGPAEDGLSTCFTVRTAGPDWEVETVYELLRWDDIVRTDGARAPWRKIAMAWAMLGRFLCNGMMLRLARAHWRFAVFFVYPYFVLLLLAGGAALLGVVVAWLLGIVAEARWIVLSAGGVAAMASLVWLMGATEARSYMLYLFDDGISTDEFARRARPDWTARLDLFAARIAAAVRVAGVDEVVVVGHSSGSFMAVDVLATALRQDPALGRHGAALSLVTLGANLPLLGFNPAGGWFVEALARVASAPDLAWLDVQSRKDVMSFTPFNQACGHGLAGPGPATLSVRFRDGLMPANYARFRWQFFRIHFQYMMANERPAAWDYFMLVCGPQRIAEAAAALTRRA